MRTVYLVVFAGFLLLKHVSAQENLDDGTNGLAVSFGAGHISISDPVFTPLIYRGTGFLTDISYASRQVKRKHSVTMSMTKSTLRPVLSEASMHTITTTGGFLHYTYQRNIKQSKWDCYLGGGIYTFASLRSLTIGSNEEVGWDLFSSVNVVASFNRTLHEKHDIELTVSYPLAAYVVGKMRIPKDFPEEAFLDFADDESAVPAGAILKSGDLLTMNKFVDVVTSVIYRLHFSGRFSAQATYRFRYYQYPKELNVKYGTSQFLAGFFYSFRK